MDETNINDQQETAEVEFSEEEDAAFDDGFSDDFGYVETTDTPDEDLDVSDEPEAQPEAEEQTEEADGGDEDASEPEEQAGTEPEEQNDAGSQRFTLTFLGENKEVSLDEMRELAEKGMNYDHVREERDALRGDKAKTDSYESFLKDLAAESGVTVENLIEDTRVRMLMQKAENEGRELSEDEARAQVRKAAKPKEESAPAAPAEKSPEEVQGEIIRRFIQLYPGLKGEDIPQSVWDEANRVGDIVGPYQKYLTEQQAKEIAELKKNLQNQKNRERSTGSRRTAGATTPKDAFDEGWDFSF